MRAAGQVITGLLILALLVGVGYYFVRKPDHRARGETYTIPMAYRELWSDVFGGSSQDEDRGPATARAPADSGRPDSNLSASTVHETAADSWRRGMELYGRGEFTQALPLLESALDRGGAPRGSDAAHVVAMVRLITLLFDDMDAGAALEGPPLARLTPPGGGIIMATLTAENDRQITFRSGTMTFTVGKDKLKNRQVARTDAQKRALAREEYRRRIEETEASRAAGAGDYLELARFCHEYGLADKVGYCIRQGLKAPGDAIEKAVYDLWERRAARGGDARTQRIRELLSHFFPHGEYTRRAYQVARRPDLGPSPGPEPSGEDDPPSGIGETVPRRPRIKDPEVADLLAKADKLKREGDEHYEQSRPGAPDAATHRKKALEAYNEAFQMYEKLQEHWGVSLENTIKILLERRYQLMKMTTLR